MCIRDSTCADERFKRVFGEQPFDAPEQRLLIFAVLRAEIYEISVNAAAFQQTELPQQRLRLLRAPLAAYQRQIAGYAVAPQLDVYKRQPLSSRASFAMRP